MLEDASTSVNAKPDVAQRWGGRVPIVIGATGHRNIDPANAKLIAALRGECQKLKKRYSSSPFIVLSALAEGADRLIAKIAMEELDADLIAVLPMPEEEYERDFTTEESKTEFRALLDRALCVKTAAVPEGDPAWKVGGEPRNEQYAHAGSIMVEHAQVLYAIWDGEPARGTGGTADQVKWFERGYAPNKYSFYKDALSPLTPLEPGLSIVIDPLQGWTRKGGQGHHGSIIESRQALSSIQSILARTNNYNRDVIRSVGTIEKSPSLVGETIKDLVDLAISNSVYRVSDSVSVYYAKQLRKNLAISYFLGFCAIFASNFVTQKVFAPWIYLGIILLMAVLGGRIWFLSVDNRYLEYRSLAEAMRTLFFLRSVGVKRPVWLAYLSRQTGVVHWFRHAVRSLEFCQDCLLSAQQRKTGKSNLASIELTKTFWVAHQKEWFSRKEQEHLQRYWAWRWRAVVALSALFVTIVILAMLTVVPDASGASLWDKWVKPDAYGDFWQVLFALFAAIDLSARDRRAHLELMKQYASQRQVFEAASRMLDSVGFNQKRRWKVEDIIDKLGEETLQAQAEWLWREHTRPFE